MQTLLTTLIIPQVADAMHGLMQDWRAYKRSAALLDFDDLLYTARNLLIGHDEIRRRSPSSSLHRSCRDGLR
jgi:ATP-dependent exoDNAse (exonuclease V) beta subunit